MTQSTEVKRRDFFADLCTDKTLEEQGAWVYLPEFEGSVRVARWGNPAFVTGQRVAMKPFRKFVDKHGAFLPETSDNVKKQIGDAIAQVVAQHILLDIKGFYAGGIAIANTLENKARMLLDDDFFDSVQDASRMRETFRNVEREEELKNSLTPSVGSLTTPQE